MAATPFLVPHVRGRRSICRLLAAQKRSWRSSSRPLGNGRPLAHALYQELAAISGRPMR